ncbi:TetR/AcrR family transcriptional regulator [Dactylosporangium sp. NPDC051541]|uniref:TetR/AcrR family transcriptional regulator n=1 Tax=Dactylosporangium sp. NPDC051541 TaxID=3363977 RepID=UPI00379B5AC3
MRADGVRNQRKVLDAAKLAFATEGLSVPVAEIARRAGVGTGTVSRHFPTKEALYEAIVLEQVEALLTQAQALDFFAYLDHLVGVAAEHRGLAEALTGAGFDVGAAAARTGLDLDGAEAALLAAAQRAGTVRPDVTMADVKALIAGCVARESAGPDPAARARMVAMMKAGLRALDMNS